VIDWSAEWCRPCKLAKPVVERMSEIVENAVFANIDVDKNGPQAFSRGITSVPHFDFYINGERVRFARPRVDSASRPVRAPLTPPLPASRPAPPRPAAQKLEISGFRGDVLSEKVLELAKQAASQSEP
jgi:thiol-disulfide isomerase/thioredoxin